MTLIFAHRGLHITQRENTVPAFLAAAALGVDGVELDVRRALDGALVVHHDAAIEGRSIGETRSSELLDAVPTLEEALAACAGLKVNVEIKNIRDPSEPAYDETGDFARQVVTHLHDAGWADSVLISCFDQDTCSVVRSCDPSMEVGWLLHWALDVDEALNQAFDLGFDAVHPFFKRLDARTAARAHELDLALNVWTVNTQSDIEAMFALGVDGIITDDPATALAVVRRSPPVRPSPDALDWRP